MPNQVASGAGVHNAAGARGGERRRSRPLGIVLDGNVVVAVDLERDGLDVLAAP